MNQIPQDLLARSRAARIAAEGPGYEEMKALVEASSFGTPGAKAIRARTPPEVVAEITRRIGTVERHRYQEAGGQTPGECRLCGNVPTATCHQVLG